MPRWQVCPECGELIVWPLRLDEEEGDDDFLAHVADRHPNDPDWLDGYEP